MAKLVKTAVSKSNAEPKSQAKSVALPKGDIDVSDFVLSHPNDKVVSAIDGEGKKQFSVLPYLVIQNLGIAKGLIGGKFKQEDELTAKVLESIYGKVKKVAAVKVEEVALPTATEEVLEEDEEEIEQEVEGEEEEEVK